MAHSRNPSSTIIPALCTAGLIFAALWSLPTVLSTYALEIGFRLLIFIVLAEAWNLLAGYVGLVSLGLSSFFGLGGYVMVGMLNNVAPSPLLGLTAGALAALVIAAIVSPALFRLRGLYFTVGTLALAESLRLYVVNVRYFGGASGLIVNMDLPDTATLFRYGVGLLAVATVIMTIASRSRISILLRAVRDDEDAASQMGVRAFRIKLGAFLVASAMTAAAGGLQATKLGAIEPYGSFGLQWSIDALTIVIIGGIGMRWGGVVGAAFVVALGELLADYPEFHIAITGVVLIFVIRFAPRGICGVAADVYQRFQGMPRRAPLLPTEPVR